MSEDRNDKLNTPAEDTPRYTVDDILSEFSSSRSHQVLPFPSREEEPEPEEDFAPPSPREQKCWCSPIPITQRVPF